MGVGNNFLNMEAIMNKKFFAICIIVLLITGNLFAGVARLTEVTGDVSYFRLNEWQAAFADMELKAGDKLKTLSKSHAKILFLHSGHSTVLAENSEMVITLANENKTDLNFFKGKLRSKVKKLIGKQSYIIQTPQAVCAVRGTDFSVSVSDEITKVEVFEGIVEAKEIITGKKVLLLYGETSIIKKNKKPSKPFNIENKRKEKKTKREARMEMFEEISRDAVLARASEELRNAEYENGKAMIDAGGNRVRLEEYIVRPEDNQFKYVVLNSREDRFDFGKILFTFDETLPDDLTLATKDMFYSELAEKPLWILTDLISVISNTKDQVNEEASGGDMIQDTALNWHHYFDKYEFSIKGYGRARKKLWSVDVPDKVETLSDIAEAYIDENKIYPDAGDLISEVYSRPGGSDIFHLRIKNTYADGTVLQVDDYLIDDEGNIQTSLELKDNFSSSIGSTFKDYLSKLNFERKYRSSEFGDRDIDIVFSTKLLLDSGMLSISFDEEVE